MFAPNEKPASTTGRPKLAVQPVDGGAGVLDFAGAVGVFPRAEAYTAKVEAEHRQAEVCKRLHGVEDDLGVHGAAGGRVRMADEGGVPRAGCAFVQHGLQAAGGTVQVVDGADQSDVSSA